MSHLDLEGLQKYAQKERKWANNAFDSIEDLNWQKTENDKVVQAYPLPEQPLEPKVSFMFKEILPEGTKSPDNPSTIEGVSSIMIGRCGKNLIHTVIRQNYVNDISVTANADGSYTLNGTATASNTGFAAFFFNGLANSKLWPDYIKHGSPYTFSINGTDPNNNVRLGFYRYWTTNFGGPMVDIKCGQTKTYTMPSEDCPAALFRLQTDGNDVIDNATVYPQIEYGIEATEFEPYIGDEYVIPLGDTYYGGTYDAVNGILEETVGYSEVTSFSSTVAVHSTTVCFNSHINYNHTHASWILRQTCAEFPYGSAIESNYECWRCWGSDNHDGCYFNIAKTRLDVSNAVDPSNPTDEEWLAAGNAWVASHPLHCYVSYRTPRIVHLQPFKILSLPQTNRLSPRLNTIYTDAQSVQVGYPKHPLRTQYELDNAILSLGGNE